jgi:hypothetical protein
MYFILIIMQSIIFNSIKILCYVIYVISKR